MMTQEISLDQLADLLDDSARVLLHSKDKEQKSTARSLMITLLEISKTLSKEDRWALLKKPYYNRYIFPTKKVEQDKEEFEWE